METKHINTEFKTSNSIGLVFTVHSFAAITTQQKKYYVDKIDITRVLLYLFLCHRSKLIDCFLMLQS